MPIETTLTRLRSLLIVLVLWAAVYLPNLGKIEFRGEEVHRVLPAVHMLRGGSWIVPRVAGKEYFAKPPGINWLIAGSFAVTGQWNEWSARMVSTVLILAFAGALVLGKGSWLSPGARLIAALSYLTFAAMMDKGRQIEIEAAYVSLTGLAVLAWLDGWAKGAPWRAWLGGAFFVAAAALVKGPLHGVVYYAMVVCVLAQQRRLRELIRPPHLASVALMAGLCAAWAIPALILKSQGDMSGRMTGEFLMRFQIPIRGVGHWFKEVALSAMNFMPWLLLAPLWWLPRFVKAIPEPQRTIFKGARWAVVLGWLAINAMPSVEGRYSMPVWPLACILVGWSLAGHIRPIATDAALKFGCAVALVAAIVGAIALGVVYQNTPAAVLAATAVVAVTLAVVALWGRIRTGTDLALLLATTVACWALLYGVLVVPHRARGAMFRPTAGRVNALTPAEQPVTLYNSGYQTWLFYLQPPVRHVFDPNAIGAETTVLVLDQASLNDPNVLAVIGPRNPRPLYTFDRQLSERIFEVVELDPLQPATATAPATGPR